jgi:hypothetical protein
VRPVRLAAAALMLTGTAWAQTPSIRSEPLPPLQQQWQDEGSPPVGQAPVAPDTTDQGQQNDEGQQTQAPPLAVTPPATMDRPNTWVPAAAVKVQALDKVNAQSAALTIKVGASAVFGSLTITAKACAIRPSDVPADAAAYLTVVDSHPDSPSFDGWMLEAEPSLSMMQHPVYDLRVLGCT